jgi:arylformamidase
MNPWIDVTMPLLPGMPQWPGNPTLEIVSRREPGGAVVSRVALGTHTGTHVDAPSHYLADGATLDDVPLDALIGRARVVAIDAEVIGAGDIEALAVARGERLLLRTRNSGRRVDAPFDERFVGLRLDAARALAARAPALVGIDYLSIAAFDADGAAVHRALLGAGVWILEGLRLAGVAPGDHDLVCLPLRIAAADGAPARALLRQLAPTGTA